VAASESSQQIASAGNWIDNIDTGACPIALERGQLLAAEFVALPEPKAREKLMKIGACTMGKSAEKGGGSKGVAL